MYVVASTFEEFGVTSEMYMKCENGCWKFVTRVEDADHFTFEEAEVVRRRLESHNVEEPYYVLSV